MHLLHPERINPRKYAFFFGCIIAKIMHLRCTQKCTQMHPELKNRELLWLSKSFVNPVLQISSGTAAEQRTNNEIPAEQRTNREENGGTCCRSDIEPRANRETLRTSNSERTPRTRPERGRKCIFFSDARTAPDGSDSSRTSKPRESRERIAAGQIMGAVFSQL